MLLGLGAMTVSLGASFSRAESDFASVLDSGLDSGLDSVFTSTLLSALPSGLGSDLPASGLGLIAAGNTFATTRSPVAKESGGLTITRSVV